MFDFFKKKNVEVLLKSPVTGTVSDIKEVPDKVFASEMMGKGVAFNFEDDTIASPVDGEITMIPDTSHAFGVKTDNGAEILVHIGLETVSLNGEGFQVLKQLNSKVTAGEPVIKINRKFIEGNGINLITPMVITNSNEYDIEFANSEKVIQGETLIAKITSL